MLKRYQTFDNYILRTPLKPLIDGFSILEKKSICLDDVTKDDVFIEALYLSSNELLMALIKRNNLSDEKLSKLKQSILKYYIRSTTRCTPFGLYAGCSIGCFKSGLKKASLQIHQRTTSLDMDLLIHISNLIKQSTTYKKLLKYYPNTSLYKLGNQHRYLEYHYEKTNRKYNIEAINENYYLSFILKQCEKGKSTLELFKVLKQNTKDENFSDQQLESFIETLISNQILVSELEPNITGKDYYKRILKTIEKYSKSNVLYEKLIEIQKGLVKLDQNSINKPIDYTKIINTINSLEINCSNNNIFQTDSIKIIKNNNLSLEVPIKLIEALSFLSKIFPPKENNYLKRFKKEFIKKYEGREMPLAFLLDSQTGLEFINNSLTNFTLIENIKLEKNKKLRKITLSENYGFFYKKLEWVIENNLTVLELKDSDLKKVNINQNVNLPNTFYTLIELYKQDNKELLFCNYAGGSSATNLISRFSQQSKEIESLVHQITEKEKEYYKEKIIAEIVHMPQNRTGNILKSKVNRDYEIVYLANSEKKKENQILIKDLVVKIKNDRIILYSTKLKKEIIPILSNAHNYSLDPLPIYEFLCQLQNQDNNEVVFNWDEVFSKKSFLPRVIYKDVIFSKASWLVNYDEIKELDNLSFWRKKRNIPKYVQLKQSDKLLLLNLEVKESILLFKQNAKKNKKITLQEYIFNTNNGIEIDNNVFSNEYIIPFYRLKNEK